VRSLFFTAGHTDVVCLVAPTALIENDDVGCYPTKIKLLPLVGTSFAPQVRTNRDASVLPDLKAANRPILDHGAGKELAGVLQESVLSDGSISGTPGGNIVVERHSLDGGHVFILQRSPPVQYSGAGRQAFCLDGHETSFEWL
jgi:hypothetical protein